MNSTVDVAISNVMLPFSEVKSFRFARGIVLVAAVVWLSIFLTACSEPKPQSRLCMGTICRINLFSRGTPKLYEKMFSRITQLENKFSVNIPTSEISLVNAAAGKNAVTVSDEVFFVVKAALEAAQATEGAFNPLILPLTQLWNVTANQPHVPSFQAVTEAKSHCDYTTVIMNEDERSIFLQDEKSGLDLGAIVKGFACDQLKEILVAEKVPSAVLDLGGNIFVFGDPGKKSGDLWNVGIRNPFTENDVAVTVFLKEGSVVTSGDYERYFEFDGQIYHHIIDWKTGFPAVSDVKSATIVSDKSMVADILSTTFFVMGWDAASKLIADNDGINAMVITKDKKILTTKNWNGKILNDEFSR